MADKSPIEWTEATWNPVVGCSILSPGCTNCYAMTMAARIEAMSAATGRDTHYAGTTKLSKAGPVWTGKLALAPDHILTEPLRWKRPRRIFVNSMSDLFHEDVPDKWIDKVFAVMALAPQHTFQVLTKRAARMRAYVHGLPNRDDLVAKAGVHIWGGRDPDAVFDHVMFSVRMPLPNVWLGVSTERQQEANERVPELLATPAAVRFVSAEPLLGPIEFRDINDGLDSLRRRSGSRLDWIIVGGESGQDARPMHPDWARSIRNQCAAAGTAFFFKQWGTWKPICEMLEEQIDACFRSNRKAKDGEDQGVLDEMYGRTCTVDSTVLHNDGTRHDALAPMAFAAKSAMTMFEIGKKRAGRLLDGREHDDLPGIREVPAL